MKRTKNKISKIVAVVAVSGFVSGILIPHSFASPDPASGSDAVLQTVNVDVAGNGSIQAIADNQLFITREDGVNVDAGHASNTYKPQALASDLPVRILTSYRTADSTGTDLSDLAGFTGKVTINVTVQNLTVAPRDLSYQVSGKEKVRAGLVGAPLTVISAVNLGIPAHSIITSDASGNQGLTNGVVSVGADGNANVQWAAVLAPPQLPSATTMTLVAEVEEFVVPNFEISVQPGFVADASVPALLRRSFEDQSRSETKLISDTIQVLADLDSSLAKTGTTIGETQAALSVSASTIGAQTVSDLRHSIGSIESSTASMIGTLDSISAQLAASLTATNTAVVSELATTVNTMRGLLGNTDATTPTLALDNQGCMSRVVVPEGENSVYGTITMVDALLTGYAGASQQCQEQIQDELALLLGPVDPTGETCTDSAGVTCELQRTHSEIRTALGQLATSSDDAVTALDLDATSRALTSMGSVNDSFGTLKSSVAAFDLAQSDEGISGQVRNIRGDIRSIRRALTRMETALDDIHKVAEEGIARTGSLEATRQKLEDEVCTMVQAPADSASADPTDAPTDASTPAADGRADNGLTPAEARRLLNYLSADGCSTPAGPTNRGAADNLERQITQDAALWDKVLAATARAEETDPETGEVVRSYHQSVGGVRTALDSVEAALTTIETTDRDGTFALDAFMDTLNNQLATVEASTANLTNDVQGIVATRDEVESNLRAVFAEAESKLAEDTANVFADGYRRIGDSLQTSQDLLSTTFSDLIVGLVESGNSITASGKEAIESTGGKVSAIATDMAAANTARVRENLDQINTTVAGAVRDLDATNTLLAQDILKVLSDIGTNTVDGTGLLGTIAASTASTQLVDDQIAQLSRDTTSFANSQRANLESAVLTSAQIDANATRSQALGPFALTPNPATAYTTVYNFTVKGTK